MPSVTPKYKHDCDHCTFAGHLSGYDVYESCDRSFYAWILRSSSDGEDYITTNSLDRYLSPESDENEADRWMAGEFDPPLPDDLFTTK